MRFVEGGNQQEILLTLFLQKVHRTRGHPVPKCEFIRNPVQIKTRGFVARGEAFLRRKLVQIAFHIVPIGGIPAVGANAVPKIVATV